MQKLINNVFSLFFAVLFHFKLRLIILQGSKCTWETFFSFCRCIFAALACLQRVLRGWIWTGMQMWNQLGHTYGLFSLSFCYLFYFQHLIRIFALQYFITFLTQFLQFLYRSLLWFMQYRSARKNECVWNRLLEKNRNSACCFTE